MQRFEHNPNRPKDPIADERIERERNGFFGFFVKRYRLTFLLLFAIVIGGILAIVQIPREADPEVKIPIAVVTTVFPGASPADIEDLITDKIESKLEELSDVRLITSRSMLGVSSITVEFQAEADLEKSIRSLRDSVNEVSGLPDEAEDPLVTEIRANDVPIITFSIAGDLNDEQLKQLGEAIQDDLESIPGVSDVPLSGVRPREFSVIVDRGSLDRLSLSLSQIVGAIAGSNVDAPLGSITLNAVDYNLRAVSKFRSIEDLRNVVVATPSGRPPIVLNDVARVEDVLAESHTLSRISLDGDPVQNTASLTILKKTGGNILEIVDEAKERIAELEARGEIPPDVSIETNTDYSQFIRRDLNTLGRSGVQAAILIFVVMLLALSFKEALISLFAIPLTFFITFIVLNSQGFTLNSLTLFSLVLSLGLLVDTFIVVLEGIFHNMRLGYGAREAALLSVAHYKKPLFAGVFTTIAAFVPMLLVSGILGEYLKWLPITISITLLSALLVTFVLVPSMAAILLRRRYAEEKKKESPLERYLTNWLRAKYASHVMRFLKSRVQKVVFSVVITILFFGSVGLLAAGVIPVQLFPSVDIDFSYIDVEMPLGTDLEATSRVVEQVEAYLFTRDDVKSFVTTVGRGASFGFGTSSQTSEHLASINVNFVDLEERGRKSFEINEEMREDLRSIMEGKVTVQELSSGPPTGAPIEARITGDDNAELSRLAAGLVQELESTEGVIDVTTDEDVSPADLTFTLNKEAVAQSGLSIPEVTGFLRAAIFGVTATEVGIEGEDIDVVVKLDKDSITSIDEIRNTSIVNARGQSVSLSRIADLSLDPSLATIRHRDFERTLTVRANLESGYTPGPIVADMEERVAAQGVPEGYAVEFGGEVEDIEQSFSELWSAMVVAIVLILVILVLQFDSFVKPFVILFAFPLIIIGVTVGVLLLQLPFSFSVFLGIVALAGISVNDAIVLIDKAGRNTDEKKMRPIDAIVDAGNSRLQPILLTSITTIIGIVPLAFADEFWLGLSVAVAFGLAFATIMQLYVIPMLFLKFTQASKARGTDREESGTPPISSHESAPGELLTDDAHLLR